MKEFPKWYLLRVSHKCSQELSLLLFGGITCEEKSFSKIKQEMQKALKFGYQKIVLPWNVVFHFEIEKIISLIKENPSHWVLQIHHQSLKSHKSLIDSLIKNLGLDCDFLIEDYDLKDLSYVESVTSNTSNFQITIAAHKDVNLYSLIQKLPASYLKKICIHFPYYHKRHPKIYNSLEVYQFLKDHHYPPPQIDIYNLSIPEDLKLEPELEPEFIYTKSHSSIQISVIIPSYNSKRTLIEVLKHLSNQDLPKAHWEVIVVDDGSFDQTGLMLKKQKFLSDLNFKYVYFPRWKSRWGIEDHRFRAGPSRNIGVQQALAPYVAFLDSDILVPPNYLSSVLQKFSQFDVIQHPRYHLKWSAPKEYLQIHKKHTFTKGNLHWENFYEDGKNWNTYDKPWKYVSTNTLCIKTEVFKKVGWFRKNYTCYGFEDTDLGWRLFQAGYSFYLNPNTTYHLYRLSEFLNFQFIKSYLLACSASIFFHNTHSLEAYKEFSYLIKKRFV